MTDHTHRHSFSTCKICDGPLKWNAGVTADGLPLTKCLNCGLLFVREFSVGGDNYADFDLGWYYTELASDKSKFSSGLNLMRTWLEANGRTLENQKILDVGCGDGYFLSRCLDLGMTAAGFDISPEVAAYAEQRGLKVFSDLKDIKDTFTLITLFDVLEHMVNPLEELLQLTKLLDDGGIIFIEVPRKCLADYYLSILDIFGIARNNRVSQEHLQLYSDKSLRILMERTNLNIIYSQNKTSLSWGGSSGLTQYISNIGIRSKALNMICANLVRILLKANIFGKNKAIILATNTATH